MIDWKWKREAGVEVEEPICGVVIMSGFEHLEVSVVGARATVTLRGPISTAVITELERLCAYLEDERPCTHIVFRGTEEAFTEGIDLTEFDLGKSLDVHGFHRWEKMVSAIEKLPMLTVAYVRGRCVGAGLHLTLACDVRIAVRGSQWGLDEVTRGFLPGMATWRLAKFLGLGRARELTQTGRLISAEQAHHWGLIDHLIGPLESQGWLEDWLNSLGTIHPTVVALNRRLLSECYAVQYEEAVGNFLAAQHRAISSPAFKAEVARAREAHA